ncbi:hypothetical protein [Vagococcus carniphilus]|uniref:hypothetical protein n=1 Tax=Vagococcus carniphilus TaxID=218144 RepID=UPI003BAADD42
MTKRKKTYLQISLYQKDKEYIQKKTKQLGYATMSAFLIDSSKSFFILNIDMAIYRKLTKEINYIGKNINSIVRRINSEKFYSDLDIEHLERKIDEIYELIKKEYKRLGELAFNFTSNDLTDDEVVKVIKAYEESHLPVPKFILLQDVYQNIHDSLVFITEMIQESKHQEEAVEEYLWNYLNRDFIKSLSDERLTEFSNRLLKYYENLRRKKINLDYHFSDDDWFDLVDILDDYEK